MTSQARNWRFRSGSLIASMGCFPCSRIDRNRSVSVQIAPRTSMAPSSTHRWSSHRQPSAVDSNPRRKAAGLSSQGGPEVGRIRAPDMYKSFRPRSQTRSAVFPAERSWALRTRRASRAVSYRWARSSCQEIRAARKTSSRSTALLGCRSSTHCRIRASSSAGSSCGRTGATVLARSPCFSALSRARALPASVFGPVELRAFLRFALT
jgi:hypothetical protein